MGWKIEMQNFPKRLQPNVLVSDLNAPIKITNQKLELRIKKGSLPCELLNGVFRFIWIPKVAFEFEGIYMGETPDLNIQESTLLLSCFSEEIPIIITNMTLCEAGWKVRGILNGCAVKSTGEKAEKLVFHLVNFPDYIGQAIRDENEKDIMIYSGRISFENEQWIGIIDSIQETEQLRKEQKNNGGFYISHVGEIHPKNEQYLDETQLDLICTNLHFLFGFCRGSWAGPLFPQGAEIMKLFGSNLLHGK